MVLLHTILQDEVFPIVGLTVGQQLLHAVDARLAIIEQTTQGIIIDHHRLSTILVGIRIDEELEETILVVLIGLHEVRHVGGLAEAIVSVVRDGGLLTALAHGDATLRGDHYDASRSTRAVDRCRRGILEHIDALDILGIEEVDIAAYHTIDNVKRTLVARNGVLTTYFDIETAACTT